MKGKYWLGLCAGSLVLPAFALEVGYSVKNDVSRPLRDIVRELPPPEPVDPNNLKLIPNILKVPGLDWNVRMNGSGALTSFQSQPMNVPMPPVDRSFLGLRIGFGGNGVPPDTNADVSPTVIGEWINTSYAFFDKNTGQVLNPTGNPIPGNALFAGFGGVCESTNNGDPIILWDDVAGRWVMSQFVVQDPGFQCFAISTSADPFGTYNRYQFNHTSAFPDYPHIGIWTDDTGTQNAYTMVSHDFRLTPQQFLGASFWAFERDKMLLGQPAAFVRFGGQTTAFGAQPVHINGRRPARGGACPVFMHFNLQSEYIFWDVCLNWATPANTVLSAPVNIRSQSFVPAFDDVAQQGSTTPLDSFGSNLMYQVAGYAFDPNAPYSLLVAATHHVRGPQEQGGVRWVKFAFEPPTTVETNLGFPNGPARGGFEDPRVLVGTAPRRMSKTLIGEGIYAPDAETRWMSSVALDRSGNMVTGFTKSSPTTNPKIMLAGRLLNDPAGQLRDEVGCTVGSTGSQLTNGGRWGDYSSTSLDPADECTFWHANEYMPTTGNQYATRLCTVRFPECGAPEIGITSIAGARVELCGATATADPSYLLRAAPLNGFTQAASFSATGVPAGATAQFDNGGGLPIVSRLTLLNGRTLPSGEYSFNAVATAGTATRTLGLTLGVSAAQSGAPTLASPADASTGVLIRPNLSWNAVAGALRYTVQVATDAGFANIVNSATVTGTSYTVNISLQQNTAYFWRVRSENYCGQSTFSGIRTFTTGVPGQCPAGQNIVSVYSDNFQNGANGWTTAGTGVAGTTNWSQVAALAGTGMSTTVWRIPNNENTTDFQLVSPTITIPAGALQPALLFDAYHSFEIDGPTGCWDGVSLEYSTDGGTNWIYLDGGRTLLDPYTGTISAGAPLAGRQAWCHIVTGGPSARAVVNLDGITGNIRLRFRSSSDSNTGAAAPNGMQIDNLVVQRCQ